MDRRDRRLVLPAETAWFCSMDWGFNAPGVILWWGHVGDGHWHIARELKFREQSAEDVGTAWQKLNREWGLRKIAAVVGDPSMWAKTGHGKGESIAETLQRYRLPMMKGDNDRKNGWQRCHELLRPAPDGRPWVTIDSTCVYGCRSLPAQQSAETDADDIDTHGDDHWVDAFRYGAMSRFVTSRKNGRRVGPPPMWSLGWLKQQSVQPQGLLARRSA